MATNDSTIRQFRVGFAEAELTELRRRGNRGQVARARDGGHLL